MWIYEGKTFESDDIKNSYGFVYVITNTRNNKKYIGKKTFWFKRTKQIKLKKKKIIVESDWKTYFGSSPELLKDVKEFGQDNFKREIVRLCFSKGECSYYEAKMMFSVDAILSDAYYNMWLSVRVQRRHLTAPKK